MQPHAASAGAAASVPAVAEALAVGKRFGPTVALSDVTLAVRPGQSHALVGRNGAGKSTLVSIMTGMVAPDEGAVRFNGQPAPGLADSSGWRRNVACVYQRTTIVPALSVAENLFLNRQAAGSLISWRALNRRAANLLEEYGVAVDASTLASDLDVETRQLVEIARSLSIGARFIILDEPTARLDAAAAARLFRRMRALQGTGVTFLFISHHLHEIYETCETVTVLRDARHVVTSPARELSRDQLVEAMTGEARTAVTAASLAVASDSAPVLEVEGLGLAGAFSDISFTARAGEIVGVAGSGSSGAAALGRSLFGLEKPGSGMIRVGGTPLQLGNVPAAIRLGVGCVPQDRQKEGIVPLLGVGENLTLPLTDSLGRFGAVNPRRRAAIAQRLIERLDVKTQGPGQPVAALSGGNQQKVVMGRALSIDPRILVLIDPTAGVDVRSKESLLSAVEQGARDGRAVVMVTDEIEDLRRCDRVLVMHRGRIVRELAAGWAEAVLIGAIEGIGRERAN